MRAGLTRQDLRRGLLRKHTEQGQQLLRRLIVGRLALSPEKDAGGRYYLFTGQGGIRGYWPDCGLSHGSVESHEFGDTAALAFVTSRS